MIRRTGVVAAEILAGVMIVAALVLWRLSAGPINLGFLTPFIEAALTAPDGSLTTKVGGTELVWASWERSVDLRVRDVRALAADGKTVAAVPALAIRLSLSALLHGVVAPTGIDMLGPRLRLVREVDGSLKLGLGDEAGLDSESAAGGLLGSLLAPPGQNSPAGLLNRLKIVDGELAIEDRASGLAWRAPSLDLDAARDEEGISAWIRGELDIGGQLVPVQGGGRYRRATGEAEASATFRGMDPAFLAARLPALEPVGRVKLLIDGSASVSFDAGQHLLSARLDLNGGRGRLALPELYGGDLPVEAVNLGLGYESATHTLRLDRLYVDLGGPKLKASGRLVGLEGPGLLEADAALEEMPTNAFKDWWPERVGSNARQWVLANLSGGMLHEAHARIIGQVRDLEPGSFVLRSIAGAMSFDGITVRYLAPLPPVGGVGGSATFSNDRFDIQLNTGVLKGLRLGPSTVAITGLAEPDQQAGIEIVLQGPLKDTLEVLDQKPLGYPSKLGLDISQVQGRVAVRLVFRFPLIKRLTLEQVALAAAANMREVVVPKVVRDWQLSDGVLGLRLDGQGMDVSGDAKLAGTPVSLAWRENFANSARERRRIDLKGRIDDGGRARLGFGTGGYLQGPVAAEVHLAQPSGEPIKVEVALDLAGASVAVPELGWREPSLKEGRASFTLFIDGDRVTRIEPIRIRAGALETAGKVSFGPGGAIETVTIERVRRGETDLAAVIAQQHEGEYVATLNGPSLDLRPLFEDETRPSSAEKTGPRLQIAIAVDRLMVLPKHAINHASAMLTSDGKVWRTISANGVAGATGSFKLALSGQDRGQTFQLTAPDAGALLAGLGVLDNLAGGSFSLEGSCDIDAPGLPFQGTLDIRNVTANRAPVLARIASLASLTGLLEALSGQGIGFSRVGGTLSQDARTVSLADFGAYGPALGLSGKGQIERASDKVHFEGTLVPAYGLGQILGAIPLIGRIITGVKSEGFLAVDFVVNGSLQEPDVTVKPLTAIAPGFLRDLVRLFGSAEGIANDLRDGAERGGTTR